ncbi:RNA polymerase factor sigma-54 [candidate division WOR-3 bacterium]|uniref:RNA polymerase factor sigma-54 n=1 Tax=candidate division WOR-3 bacterium TaxID=2052148 RepID=A0A937XFZ4_UNCW3|nr:RNA polymerase factor sigma-54 [candidate division WOR-3 bacterium]
MRMGLGLDLKQQLEMRLTPQLILQMKLLQVTALDLEQLVREEMEQNPALEESDGSPSTVEAEVVASLSEPVPEAVAPVPAENAPAPETHETQIETKPGEEYTIGELMPDDGWSPAVRAVAESDDEQASAVDLAAGPAQRLVECLMPHLRSVLSEDDARVAAYVIESLDDDGFLTMTDDEIAREQDVDPERLRSILYAIQRLEPGGIACHDRRESFLVQLELAGADPASLERKVLTDHWDLLVKKQTAKIAKLCGVTEDEVRRAVQRLMTLETRPARCFAPGTPDYVSPDFSVEWQGDTLVASANDERFPRLRLSQRYIEILKSPKSYTPEQVQFARQKLQRALMFLKGIESRRRTLKRLVELIIDEQRDFFLHGKQHLKPATLRQAADVIGVHASTVSRAIAGKYLETDQGIFPFGYFFKAGAGDKSRTSIKQKIQAIVNAEDRQKPLSDDEICTMLKTERISISRRTVAKYRAELGVPACNDRKCF